MGRISQIELGRGERLKLGFAAQISYNYEDRRGERLLEGPSVSKGPGMGCTGHRGTARGLGRQSAWGWSPLATSNLSRAPQKAT